jgi:hypothetical protein
MHMKTSVVHFHRDDYDVYIGRPSKWANPYTHIANRKTQATYVVATRADAIRCYEEYLIASGLIDDIHELRGKVLGCWCKPKSCHGDVLAKYANSLDKPTIF